MDVPFTARPYGSALRASYRSTRARLMSGSECLAAKPPEAADQRAPTVAEADPVAAPETAPAAAPAGSSLPPDIASLVDAVAAETGLSREVVMTDIVSERAAGARKLAAALAVRRLGCSRADAAQAFAILEPAVRAGLRHLDRVLIARAIPADAELVATLRLVVVECGLDQPPRPTIAEIKRAFAAAFGVTRAELESPQRHLPLAAVRQLAMALAKRLCARSLSEIGRQFGGRDHTTVIHAVSKMAPLVEIAAQNVGATAGIEEWVRAARAAMESNP